MRSIFILKHERTEGGGTFEEYLARIGRRFDVIELSDSEKLPALGDCEAIISLGGPMNVYEEERYPFLTLEDGFLKGAIEREIPTIGICLGAQLLAKCMGAGVSKAREREIGWYSVSLSKETDSDTLFGRLPRSMETFHWHEDTFDIPQGGALLASSKLCHNQAFRIGKSAWGIQFHPEMTGRMIKEWCEASPFKTDKKRMVERYRGIKDAYENNAVSLYDNFMKVVDGKTL